MKSVMISVNPKWCDRIVDREKTIEVRKTKPKLNVPFKCYIYCTAGDYEWKKDCWSTAYETANGSIENMSQKVIGEFVCDKIFEIKSQPHYSFSPYGHCLSNEELWKYSKGKALCGWHISNLKIYDEPKELSSFYKGGMLSYDDWLYGIYNGHGGATSRYESYKNVFKLKRPPQSWCYVEEMIQ